MASYTDPTTPPETTGWVWSAPLGQWIQPPRPTVPNPIWSSELGTWITNAATLNQGASQPTTAPAQTPTTGNTRPPSTPPTGPTTGGSWMGPTVDPFPTTTQEANPLAGYGFGIPGYETKPMVGGGSWEGTVWPGAQYSGLKQAYLPVTAVTDPTSPYYRPIYNAGNINTDTSTTPGFSINPAVPYQTTWYQQTYGGKPPPWINIHEQMGDAMKGIPAAKPSYNWASPQALAQLGGYGLPGGWTSMLGFTPGGAKNG